ncbi:zinc-binding alcohol dehydrogenase family protein [Flagellimonas sp. HMM57]|uniref:zinc-binding alcohol dehydrogenase family protein n=1 Tax=unclassified Flagellimonas TaxID=2644544 RepID=UPI0013D77158|nr:MULTISPECIES: zinc-binding alcohol dehydrogenase family protein [unclassified Flagellimonas]UII75364.1 zinc-binding alcohol dehydrogenase family protein [Flagellimonas sp. HMM57]
MTKVIRLKEPGVWETYSQETSATDLQVDEALVKVSKMGVCGTDLHAFKGNQPFFQYPRILGHELAVEVLKTGIEVTNVKVGDRCSVEPYYNEKVGQAARRGKTNCGDYLRVYGVHVDGGMQQLMKLPSRLLHPSKTLSNDQLALIEPLAIGCHAVDRAEIKEDDIVLVIGAGPIGLGAVLFAQLTGARVLVMDIDAQKLSKATEITKVNDTVLVSDHVEENLEKLLDGDLPTIILDATGNPISMHNTFKYVAAGGTIVFIGLFQGDVCFNDPYFHKKELTLKASRAALHNDFKRIIELMEAGKIDPTSFITHRIHFNDVPMEFEKLFAHKDLVKALIEF